MCNDYRLKHLTAAGLFEGVSQLKIPFRWAAGGPPNFEPRDDIRITDRAPVLRWAGDAAELATLPWAWKQNGRPVFNFRADGRDFSRSERVLIPTDGFYEFTAPADPGKKLKDKWLFTLTGEPWFWIAGIVKEGAFSMLTTPPGEDVAPYHDRQVAVVPLARTAEWLVEASPAVLQPLAPGSLSVEKVG
ncbi:MAG TPA: SOS response-associated peptidase family protein [Caulobacteraceae bacterium]